MHYTNNCRRFYQESNGVLISIINDKRQRCIGVLVQGDDELVDAQVSGCQGGLFGCHPSCFRSGTVHYSPCEVPLYIAWYCEHGELNNATHNRTGPAALPTVQRPSSSERARGWGGGVAGQHGNHLLPLLWSKQISHQPLTAGEPGPRDPVSSVAECFLLGFLGLATSLASLRVSLPTEPLIKRGFV